MKLGTFRDWNFARFFRLAAGIGIIIQACVSRSWEIGLLGFYFAVLPLFSAGCFGTGSSDVPGDRSTMPKRDLPTKH